MGKKLIKNPLTWIAVLVALGAVLFFLWKVIGSNEPVFIHSLTGKISEIYDDRIVFTVPEYDRKLEITEVPYFFFKDDDIKLFSRDNTTMNFTELLPNDLIEVRYTGMIFHMSPMQISNACSVVLTSR